MEENMSITGLESLQHSLELTHIWINDLDERLEWNNKPRAYRLLKSVLHALELSPKVGDGGNREGGISWGCLTPPLLHRRSDMPCPKITSSS